ncbi:probable RNA-directed DNA polymerase from transposon X-element [Helicoverpa armigera]|uniref:probable RNA-directed DNA polymerase from transposon X-element n=1 Tax=Helicoverpa armigera TaxID=29058 RepID=UPI003083CF10
MSVQQLEALVDYLEGQQELALGRCTRSKEGRSLAKRLWQECATILNNVSVDSAQKTGEQWRMFYNDYKYRLLKKIKKEKIERSATARNRYRELHGNQRRVPVIQTILGVYQRLLDNGQFRPHQADSRRPRIASDLEERVLDYFSDNPHRVGHTRAHVMQQDGAPAHYHRAVRSYLDATYPNYWIGRGGPIAWPPRSPDPTPLDFYLWGRVKDLVYGHSGNNIRNVDELKTRILEALVDYLEGQQELVLSGMPTRQRLGAPRRKINWDAFTNKLEITTPTRPIVSPADVDGLAEEVTVCIQSALNEATTVSPQGATAYPPLPRHLQQLIAQKRRLRKRWQVTRCPTEKAVVNRLAERIKAELNAHRSESWEARIDAVDGDWPSIHRLCRQLSNTPAPVRPLLDSGGALRYTAPDRAEIFAEHLERQFRPNDTQDAEHVAAVEKHLGDYFASPIASEEDPIFFAPGAVRRAILRTKLKKAPGADGITNTALRHLPYRMVVALARLYTGILRTGTFPRIWKEGRVIMLPKAQKNVLKPESYRPITLLPTISKVFELLLLRHLTPHLTPRPEQYGFRAEHSTTLQLTRVLHHFANTVNRREHAVAVFLDMEKAFDRVWHPGLIYKISTSDTPRRITQVISSFLTGRTIRVVVDGALSSARPVRAGVPQGSCLSPVCYSRYTDDIPSAEDSTLALYADDAAYITTSMSAKHAIVKMQRVLDLLPEWLSKWRLSVNVGKTQAIIIGGGPARPPKLALQGAEIEWSPRVKYLGVTIDRRLTMAAHVRQVAGKGRVARALLKPVLSSRLPLRTKLAVYKTYIRPVLTYAAPAWFALTSERSRKTLRSQQSACLRLIAQAPRYVRNDVLQRDLKMESLDEFVRRLSEGMFARADASAWLHVKHLAPLHARPPDAKALPRDLLPDAPPPPD